MIYTLLMDARVRRLSELEQAIVSAEKCLRSYTQDEKNLVVLALKLEIWKLEHKKLLKQLTDVA